MIKLHSGRVIYAGGRPVQAAADAAGREKTMAYGIMRTHGGGDGGVLRLKFDSLISHDITYVGVIQTAKVLELIHSVRERGLAVVFISHNLPQVIEVADRIEVMRLGARVARFRRGEADVERLIASISGAYRNEGDNGEGVPR